MKKINWSLVLKVNLWAILIVLIYYESGPWTSLFAFLIATKPAMEGFIKWLDSL